MFSEFKKSFRLGIGYLKCVACSVTFYAILFLAVSLFSQHSKKTYDYYNALTAAEISLLPQEQLKAAFLFVTIAFIISIIVIIIVYAAINYLIYRTLSKSRFSLKTLIKFIPAFLFACIMLFIPFAFAAKLGYESSAAARAVSVALFLVLLFLYFHILNLVFYHLASSNRLWHSIKSGLKEAIGIRKFLVPYFSALIVLILIIMSGLLIKLLPETASLIISIMISALYLNWLRFFVAEYSLKHHHLTAYRNR